MGPVTAGAAPASASRTRVHGPAARIGQRRPDHSLADAIQKAQPPRVRAANRAVEPEMEADIRTSASASLAGAAEIREGPEVPGGRTPRAVTAEPGDSRAAWREAGEHLGGQCRALHAPGWPGPAEIPETPQTPYTQPGDNRTAPGDKHGIDRTAGKGSPGFSR